MQATNQYFVKLLYNESLDFHRRYKCYASHLGVPNINAQSRDFLFPIIFF